MATMPAVKATSHPTTRGGSRTSGPKLGSLVRILALAIALIASALMVNGARWMLQSTPAAANEFNVARCVLDAIEGAVCPADLCKPTDTVTRQRPMSGSGPGRGSRGGELVLAPNSQTLASS